MSPWIPAFRSIPACRTSPGVYDYWLGGQDNVAEDRELAKKFMAASPSRSC
jgi:hypothetical protein